MIQEVEKWIENTPFILTPEQMSQEDLNEILSIGLMQAKNEEGHELEDAFEIINSSQS